MNTEIGRHIVYPIGPLMCKQEGLVAMKVVYDFVICRRVKKLHIGYMVVHYPANHNIDIGTNGTNQPDVFFDNPVPCIGNLLKHHLI